MPSKRLCAAGLGWLVASLISCSDSTKNAAAPVGLFGQVRTEDGTPLAGAQVCFVGTDSCVQTDALGRYTKPTTDKELTEPVVVQFSTPGYARRIVRMRHAAIAQAGVIMRRVDTQMRVALPAAGASPVVVQATHDDASSSLRIGPNALVDAAGAIATGNANVSLTFFHPLRALHGAPGALNATDSNGIKGLFTWGMADIEVEQDGALLNVAPGQSLGWDILEPPTVAKTLSPNAAVPLALPDLYSLDANTGLWHLEGTAATGHVSYDANNATVMTQLAHLSSWNVDSDASAAYGGCVSGRIVDPCGQPVAQKAITIWFLGLEQLKDWTGTVTASDGTFCTPTYLSSWNISGNNLNINYFVAGAGSYTDTSMCNPAPASCFVCVDESAPYSTMGWCTDCCLDPTHSQPANGGAEQPTYYTNTCNAPSINLVPYSSCSNGNCTAIGDIVLPSATCGASANGNSTANANNIANANNTGSAAANANSTAVSADPCANGTGKKLGQACTSLDVCCPHTLVCEDLVCVPPQDGG